MNIISNTINTLNPGKIPADTADQPIFALAIELMIRFLDKFGPDKYLFFGSLHVKESLLIISGQVIKGSGLDEIMCTCGLSIVGADSLVTVNDIKRARYCLQVGACVIYSKLKQAHIDSKSDELILSWLANKSKIKEMCFYWKLVLEFMIDLLVLIRSLRKGKYPYIASLRKLIRWYFALDHYNYARWLSVHIYDLLALPQNLPQLHRFFMDRYFTFQKTDCQVLLMGLDSRQIHQQNNAVMKGMGGATSSLKKVDESS